MRCISLIESPETVQGFTSDCQNDCVCEWTGECACMCKCVYVASLKRHMAFTDMDKKKERESGQKGKVN